jgi:hypothetical protein
MAELVRCTVAHWQGNDFVGAGTILPVGHELILEPFFEDWEPPSRAAAPVDQIPPVDQPPVSEGDDIPDDPNSILTEPEPVPPEEPPAEPEGPNYITDEPESPVEVPTQLPAEAPETPSESPEDDQGEDDGAPKAAKRARKAT